MWYKFSQENQDERYFVYLTRLGFMLFVFAVCLDAILVLARYLTEQKYQRLYRQPQDREQGILSHRPCHETRHFTLKLSMFVTYCSYSVAFMITLVYFAALFKVKDNFVKNYLNFAVHLFQVSYFYV